MQEVTRVCYTNDTGINYDINLPNYRKDLNFLIVKKIKLHTYYYYI